MNPVQEINNIADFLREVMGKPDAVIARSDIMAITEGIINRPVIGGDFPDVELFNMIVSRMLSDPDRLSALKRTPFEPIVALLPYISQSATAYKDWFEQKQQKQQNVA